MRAIHVEQSTNAVPTSSICSLRTHPAAFDPLVCCFVAGDVSCALGLFFFCARETEPLALSLCCVNHCYRALICGEGRVGDVWDLAPAEQRVYPEKSSRDSLTHHVQLSQPDMKSLQTDERHRCKVSVSAQFNRSAD